MVMVAAAPAPNESVLALLVPRDPVVKERELAVVAMARLLCRSIAGEAPDELLMVRFNILPAVPSVKVPEPDMIC